MLMMLAMSFMRVRFEVVVIAVGLMPSKGCASDAASGPAPSTISLRTRSPLPRRRELRWRERRR